MIEKLLDDVLIKEGGFVNHPADKGGVTNYGITQATLQAWRGKPVTVNDVKCITPAEAKAIYRSEYFELPRIDELPTTIQPVMFDMAVNHGPSKAIKIMQSVLDRMSGKRISLDGKIGPVTIAAANIAVNVYGQDVVRQISHARAQFYKEVVKNDPSQAVFLKGWLARAESFVV